MLWKQARSTSVIDNCGIVDITVIICIQRLTGTVGTFAIEHREDSFAALEKQRITAGRVHIDVDPLSLL